LKERLDQQLASQRSHSMRNSTSATAISGPVVCISMNETDDETKGWGPFDHVPIDHQPLTGSGLFRHDAIAHSHSQRSMPRGFLLLKRCERLVGNWTVSIWTSLQRLNSEKPLGTGCCEWLWSIETVIKRDASRQKDKKKMEYDNNINVKFGTIK